MRLKKSKRHACSRRSLITINYRTPKSLSSIIDSIIDEWKILADTSCTCVFFFVSLLFRLELNILNTSDVYFCSSRINYRCAIGPRRKSFSFTRTYTKYFSPGGNFIGWNDGFFFISKTSRKTGKYVFRVKRLSYFSWRWWNVRRYGIDVETIVEVEIAWIWK